MEEENVYTRRLTLQLSYFFYAASMSSIMPFLTIYFNNWCGQHSASIGMLNALSSITAWIVTPLWANLADRTGEQKKLLLATVASGTLLRLCFLLPYRNYAWYLVIVQVLSTMLRAPVRSLHESLVISNLPKSKKSNHGKISQLAPLGKMLLSPVVIYLIGNSSNGFYIAFAMHAFFTVPMLICIMLISDARKKPKQTVEKDPSAKKKRLVSLFLGDLIYFYEYYPTIGWRFWVHLMLMGSLYGYSETFAYVYIQDLSSSSKILSVCRIFLSLGNFIGFRLSSIMIQNYGSLRSISFSAFAYAFGLLSYSYLYISFQHSFRMCAIFVIAAETLRGSSFACMWSASIVYINASSLPGRASSDVALVDSIYSGIGKTLGSLLGGKLVARFGMCYTFFILGFALMWWNFIFSFERNSNKVNPKKAR